jgi:dTDP-4-dehydrorhamnose 3,5-epimerase
MEILELPLLGLKKIRLKKHCDDRGFFCESYRKPLYASLGIDCDFLQDNLSFSKRGTLRGMHFQSSPGQAKLVTVLQGKIFDVVVDIRKESPTFGKWEGVFLDSETMEQLFVPVGFAHGFCVVSESAYVSYKVSEPYNPKTECGFRYNDPDVAIEWPVKQPLLSPRDLQAPSFREATL